ncbi:MAG: DNA-processing protein DprA [Candidatus Latescibacterota bacterium]
MSEHEIVYEYDDQGDHSEAARSGRRDGNAGDFGNVREILPGDDFYPKQLTAILGNDAPRKLSCCGDISLLVRPGVMVCGARDASEEAIGLAYRCGELLAASGVIVASGYARGVDMAAHRGALDAGGSTLAFLPYGIARFKIHRDIRDVFDPERFFLVSELEPWQVFSSYAALRRNKLLAALAEAVIVVEPGETGGTWYSAERAQRLARPLFFLEGSRPEIVSRLESLGGVRLTVRDGGPDINPVKKRLFLAETQREEERKEEDYLSQRREDAKKR